MDHTVGNCHLKTVCKHRGKDIGNKRKSSYYSILKREWPMLYRNTLITQKSDHFHGLFSYELETKFLKTSPLNCCHN